MPDISEKSPRSPEEGGSDRTFEPVIAVLTEVWESIALACADLEERSWELATDCPGWTVRDQISHLIGIERMLLGESAPELDEVPVDDARTDMGRMNETWVVARRVLPGPLVLEEFKEITQRRLEELRTFPTPRFDETGWSPIGQVPYRRFMEIRVMDSWVHEQDIRRACERPGGRGGGGEQCALDRVQEVMPYVVGRTVAPSDGTTVAWRVLGPLPKEFAVEVVDGRGRQADPISNGPTVLIALRAEEFWRLGYGRITADQAVAEPTTAMLGDADLGLRVLESMNFMI